ncbi:MAG: hypothetical protein Q7R49_05760, partial [Candidatus Daviesbacteria bacterium]|nr:hypothetical protein [Candidatus Daviesbacteria bacterium]
MNKLPWPKIILVVTLFATIAGAIFSTKTLADINKNIAAAKEATRPANVKIIKINTPNCTDCFNVDSAIAGFKKLNVKVEEEKTLAFDSPEASASIKQLAIKRVPTYFVTGEVTKNNLEDFVKSNGELRDNTFIFTKLSPVFIDTGTGQEMGRVDLIYLTDSSCTDCYKAQDVQKPILTEGYGAAIRSQRSVDISSVEGKSLLARYGITKVPTILISPEADQYANLKNVWKNVG